jgi:tRNA (guanine37-N1)-methyltransferase
MYGALLRFDVFTLFPAMFAGPIDESILRRAREAGLIDIAIHDIRDWTHGRHRSADDRPYGGGPGMIMMAPPIVEAVESVLGDALIAARVLVMSPGGTLLTQAQCRELAGESRIVIICGHYEGVDQRVIDLLHAKEMSIGNYVLTGGELPAMVVIDAVSRLVPGVIDEESATEESHEDGQVEYPQYTRPAEYRGLKVPEVLLSGHHRQVREWRVQQKEDRTRRRHPSKNNA